MSKADTLMNELHILHYSFSILKSHGLICFLRNIIKSPENPVKSSAFCACSCFTIYTFKSKSPMTTRSQHQQSQGELNIIILLYFYYHCIYSLIQPAIATIEPLWQNL